LISSELQAMARLAKSKAEALTRPVEITTPAAHAQPSHSVQAVLGQTAAHNGYHVGQIVTPINRQRR
jgi:hypothetical protein